MVAKVASARRMVTTEEFGAEFAVAPRLEATYGKRWRRRLSLASRKADWLPLWGVALARRLLSRFLS